MNKICVYTCITGDYDNLQELEEVEEGIDYYCFTNNKNIKSGTWNVVYIEDESLSNIELARKTKILGNSIVNQYDIAVWIDGSVKFVKKIKNFINEFFTENDVFSGFKHGERDNIKDECYECVIRRKETKEKVKALLQYYQKQNYHFDNGLIESTVFIKRPKDDKVIETMEKWFSFILNYSHRDQLSFNYCISQTKMPVHWINLKVFDNDWFKCMDHGNDKVISSYRVYFDNNKKYNINYDFSGKMIQKGNNQYQIKIKVPCDCKKTVVELSRIPFIQISNIKINSIKNLKINYFNGMEKNGNVYFLNENPAFEIYNLLKARQTLTITMELKQLNNKEMVKKIYDNVVNLEEENNDLKNQIRVIKNQNRDISVQLNQIKNRKVWKFISFFDKIIVKRKE